MYFKLYDLAENLYVDVMEDSDQNGKDWSKGASREITQILEP